MMASEWQEVELGPVCSKVGSGATPRGGSGVYLASGEVALIRSQNIHNQGFSRGGIVYITEEHAQQLANVEVLEGDVLLNITGDSVARCCQVDPGILPARVNQHVAIIRPKPDEIDAGFLRYFMVSPQMQSLMLSWSHAGATRKALTKGMIKAFKVSKPELPVQRRIAGVLGSLDDKIELNRRMNETLEGMAAALFKSWFVDFDPVIDNALEAGNPIPKEFAARAKTRQQALANKTANRQAAKHFPATFQKTKELGWIPEGWETKPVSEIVEVNPKVKLTKGTIAKYVDMKALPSSGFCISGYIEKEYKGGSKFCKNDVLLARITPCLENGKTSMAYFLEEGEAAFGSTEFIVLRGNATISHEFVYCLARDAEFRKHCIASMVGSSGRQRVQNYCFDHYPMAIPKDSDLLTAFTETIRPMFQRIVANSEEIQTLTQIRDTLLPKLISGEVGIT